MSSPKRWMVFLHYDPQAVIDAHVLHLLRSYRPFCRRLIFVSNAPLSEAEQKKASEFADEIRLHDNRGYDFAAWKDVILSLAPDFSGCGELILTNSSCFGPIFPLEEMFSAMDSRECDFWGITRHARVHGFPEHLASYFIAFRPRVLNSPAFLQFWRSIRSEYRSMAQVIHHGEHRLTPYLRRHGFRDAVYCELPDTREDRRIDFFESFTTSSAAELIRQTRCPLLKVKSFQNDSNLRFPKARLIFESLRDTVSPYPCDFIIRFLRRTAPASWLWDLPGTSLITDFCQTPFRGTVSEYPCMDGDLILVKSPSNYPDMPSVYGDAVRRHAERALYGDGERLRRIAGCFDRESQLGLILPSIPPVMRFAGEESSCFAVGAYLIRRTLFREGVPMNEIPDFVLKQGFYFRVAASAEEWASDAVCLDAGMQNRRNFNGRKIMKDAFLYLIWRIRSVWHRACPRLSEKLMPLEDFFCGNR